MSNKKIWAQIVVLMLCLCALVLLATNGTPNGRNDVNYRLELYYLGGSIDTIDIRVSETCVPTIISSWGSYRLSLFPCLPDVKGVVRFKILFKDVIKNGAIDSDSNN